MSSFYQRKEKFIEALSARASNPQVGYRRARLTRKYLHFCSNRFSDGLGKCKASEPTRALAIACGFAPRNLEKFRRRRWDWINLTTPAPFRFLDAIGVCRKTLDLCMEQDLREYETFSARVAYPTHFGIRIVGCFCSSSALPEGINEAEAIEYVKDFVVAKKHNCWLSIEGMRTTQIHLMNRREGIALKDATMEDITVETTYYPPRFIVNKHSLTLTEDNSKIGLCYIK